MQVILLERVEKLGQMGDVVKVKDGFARNFLLPKKKALRATKAEPCLFRNAACATRGAQPRAQVGSRGDRQEARRQDLHAAAPGGRPRPALWFGQPARHRRCRQRRRLHHRPHAGAARQGDQDHRPVPDSVVLHPEVRVHRDDQCRAHGGRSRTPGARRRRAGRTHGSRRSRGRAPKSCSKKARDRRPRRPRNAASKWAGSFAVGIALVSGRRPGL